MLDRRRRLRETEADGYWLWLAEIYFRDDSPAAKAALAPYEAVRRLIPPVEELRASGYDQYLKNMDDATLFEGCRRNRPLFKRNSLAAKFPGP